MLKVVPGATTGDFEQREFPLNFTEVPLCILIHHSCAYDVLD